MKAGQHSIELKNIGLPNGDYGFKLVAAAVNGGTFEPRGRVSGIVSGFVPGPDPMLIIDGKEVSPGKVTEVSLPT